VPPTLVTIPGVELVEAAVDVSTSTGIYTFTAEHLAAAVAAQDDPAVRSPIVKLGHIDPRFDGEPAVGVIRNLRLSANGMTLLGDLVGVPAWLAEILPSAYPSRSIEAWFDYTSTSGTKHPFVLTGLALLGVSAPALQSLEDVRALYETPEAVQVELVAAAEADRAAEANGGQRVVIEQGDPMPKRGRQVAASVNMDEVRRAYYDAHPREDLWIREVWNDFIVSEDWYSEKLYRVPWSVEPDGRTITFGEPIEVRVEYVEVPAEDAAAVAASAARMGRSDLDHLAERYGLVKAAEPIPDPAPAPAPLPPSTSKEEDRMDPKLLRQALGLAEDATDEEVKEALKAKAADLLPTPEPEAKSTEAEDTSKPAETPALPEGVVAIDAETLEGLKVAAAAGQRAEQQLRTQARDRFLGEAVKAGKFAPARLEHWRKAFDADEEGTRQVIAGLAEGLVPVEGTEVGHAGSEGASDDDAFFGDLAKAGMLPGAIPTSQKGAN
jgi:hypothetical protein